MHRRQFSVIGLGRLGYYVAKTLSDAGFEVLALDVHAEKVQAVSEFVTYALQCDSTDERALGEAGVQNSDVAIVSVGDQLEASILTVMNLQQLGMKEIVAKAINPTHGNVLVRLGVKRVVYPERESAIRVARSLILPNLLEYLELAPGYSVAEIPVPHSLASKTLRESQIRTLYQVNVIAIKGDRAKGKEAFNHNPAPEDLLAANDVLVIIGKDGDIERLSNLK